MKRHKFKILSLLAVLALTMSVLGLTSLFAAAETTYTPTNIFSTSGASRAEDENYIAYNMSDRMEQFHLPNLLNGMAWSVLIDTSDEEMTQRTEGEEGWLLESHSIVIFKAVQLEKTDEETKEG